MAIDFTLPPDVVAVRERVRAFMEGEVAPAEAGMRQEGGWRKGYAALREKARATGLWAPHMPPECGGMGLGPDRDRVGGSRQRRLRARPVARRRPALRGVP